MNDFQATVPNKLMQSSKPLIRVDSASVVHYPDGTLRLYGIVGAYPEWHMQVQNCVVPGHAVTTSAIVNITKDLKHVETERSLYLVSNWNVAPTVDQISLVNRDLER